MKNVETLLENRTVTADLGYVFRFHDSNNNEIREKIQNIMENLQLIDFDPETKRGTDENGVVQIVPKVSCIFFRCSNNSSGSKFLADLIFSICIKFLAVLLVCETLIWDFKQKL